MCEGDSAKLFVTTGLDIIGKEYNGCFPLRGKPINVSDIKNDKAGLKKLEANEEIVNIKKIMGLR